MKLSDQQKLFTRDTAELICFANSIGVELTYGEVYRTKSQGLLNFYGFDVRKDGDELVFVKRKRTSWTLRSKHLSRMAVDFNFFIDGKLLYNHPKIVEIGKFWESLSPQNVWGGSWLDKRGRRKDTPHFQRNILR